MRKTIFTLGIGSVLFFPSIPQLSGMLGVSVYAARKIIDAIVAGASMWTVIALLVAGGGAAAIVWALAKKAIKRFTYTVALTW